METTLRPDTVLASDISKQVILLELILPLGERLEEASERKRGKICRCAGVVPQSGWWAWCLPIEVGTREFAGRSLCKTYTSLGILGARKKESHRPSFRSFMISVVHKKQTAD